MLSLKKFGINYYNIFLILIAFASLVLSIIAFTRKEESFGEIFDEKCLKQEFIETNYGNCCKDVVDNRKEEMRHLCWEAAIGILSQKRHLQEEKNLLEKSLMRSV
jgi:hypothetical protein